MMSSLSPSYSFLLGVGILLLVDLIWVFSAEITRYLFHEGGKFDKPFFSCYLKFSLFTILFPCYGLWKVIRKLFGPPVVVLPVENPVNGDLEIACSEDTLVSDDEPPQLSEPLYVRTLPSEAESGVSDAENDLSVRRSQSSVRFAQVSEVRHLPIQTAEEAMFARLSYEASLRSELAAFCPQQDVPVKTVAKLALQFCLIFFCGNYLYQLALQKLDVAIVNTLSTSSCVFALVFSLCLPSANAERITPTKVIAVFLNMVGVALVALSSKANSKPSQIALASKLHTPSSVVHHSLLETFDSIVGVWLALGGAFLYSVYAVLLTRCTPEEGKLNVPLFFGFVGLYSTLFFWPCFFALHYLNIEEFQIPGKSQLLWMLLNGVVGTVISELLWAWGCLMTSSVMATLLPSLVIPLSILTDHLLWHSELPLLVFIGIIPVIFSMLLMTYLKRTGLEDDPVIKCLRWCWRSRRRSRRRRRGASRINDLRVGEEENTALIGDEVSLVP